MMPMVDDLEVLKPQNGAHQRKDKTWLKVKKEKKKGNR